MRRRRSALVVALVACIVSACGNFTASTSTYTAQPSLIAAEVTPVLPQQPAQQSPTTAAAPSSSPSSSGAPRSSPSSSGAPSSSAPPSSGAPSSAPSTAPADPCTPTDPAVVAACLAAPWGLVPLADGVTALVGERTTGRILRIAAGKKPVLVTTVAGIDATGDGGLLGLAVAPSYTEDGLIYAYVTTKTDNRVIRIAAGDQPKPILAGIPKGPVDNGGAIAFTGQGVLYVGTGDAGSAGAAADGKSLAGKLLRIDEFGKPAAGNPVKTSPVFSSGFTQVTGLCVLPTGAMAAIDHRTAADVLLVARSGKNYSTLASGDAVWTWKAGDGGASDCAASQGVLANTSPAKQQLAGINMSTTGTFSGTTRVLLGDTYGRLLTVEPGAKGALWLTTTNKDGHGKPVAADDRVILLPNAGSAGGGGPE